MSNFANIKAKKADLQKLQQQAQETNTSTRDERLYKHKTDENNVGTALIRFLPRYDAEGEMMVPWITWNEYQFGQKPNQYWERSLKSIGKDDPVAALNKAHWASIPESEKKNGAEANLARLRKIKSWYMANIVVLDDPKNPENNGKVFLYKFGNAIKNKLEAAWFPEYEDQTPLVFFDWDEGANFRIRTKNDSKGWYSYDDSAFEAPSALGGGKIEVQEFCYNHLHDLAEFESEDNYKSYEELEAKMIKVLGARTVCRIMGEEYSPAKIAEAGGNAFAAQQSSTQQEPAEEKQVDPFAGLKPEPAQGTGVASETQQETPAQKQVDPFANMGKDDNDVFANLNIT